MKPLLDKQLKITLSEQVKKINADYAEIRVEEISHTQIVFKGEEPQLIAEPTAAGFFIRVLKNGAWGVVAFTNARELVQRSLQALSLAKQQGKGEVTIAYSAPVQAEVKPFIKKDFQAIPLSKKVALTKHYNNLLLKGAKGIQTTNMSYSDTYSTKYFVNSRGTQIFQARPYVRLSYQAIAKSDSAIEMQRGSIGHIGGFEIVENLDEKMLKVAKEAVDITRSPKVKSGKYTVVLDPFMAGTFAHEAFGHLAEADHQYENPELLKQMAVGRKLGSSEVTIIDDPDMPSGWGNFTYDDEGVQAEKVYLLNAGLIAGRLHSLETAAKLKELPNGRARADGYQSRPIVRMSNTFFEQGKHKLEDLILNTKRGLLVVNWLAGMTALENFTFTAMYGVMIEKGKLTSKVRGVKLMGNVFETLKNIDGVSSDFAIDEGTCGKGGQHIPVGAGGGYVRVHNVSVGGE